MDSFIDIYLETLEKKPEDKEKVKNISSEIIKIFFKDKIFNDQIKVDDKFLEEIVEFNKDPNTNSSNDFVNFLKKVCNKKDIPTYLPCYESENWQAIFEEVFGKILISKNNPRYNQFQEVLREVILKIPKLNKKLDSETCLEQGKSFAKLKKYKEAIKCVEESIKLNQKNSEAYLSGGSFYLELSKIEEKYKNIDNAKKYLDNESLKENHKAFFGKALVAMHEFFEGGPYYRQGIYFTGGSNAAPGLIYLFKTAIKLLDKKTSDLDKKGENYLKTKYEYLINFGLASFFHTSTDEKSTKLFQEAIELIPENYKNCTAYFNKGLASNNLERYEEAIECFENATKIKKDLTDDTIKSNKDDIVEDYKIYFFKGVSFANLKKYKEATECFENSIKLNKENNHKADFFKNEASFLKKEASLFKLFFEGVYFDSINNNEEAIKCFEELIKIDQENYKAYEYKSNILIKLKKYGELARFFRLNLINNEKDYFDFRMKIVFDFKKEVINSLENLKKIYGKEGEKFFDHKIEDSDTDKIFNMVLQNDQTGLNDHLKQVTFPPSFRLMFRMITEELEQRGSLLGVYEVFLDAIETINKDNDFLRVFDKIAEHYLEACVNQPVAGFTQIALLFEMAKRNSFESKLDIVKIFKIINIINTFIITISKTGQSFEVETGNLVLIMIHEMLLKKGIISEPWPGIPEKIFAGQGVNLPLINLKNQKIQEKIRETKLFSKEEIEEIIKQEEIGMLDLIFKIVEKKLTKNNLTEWVNYIFESQEQLPNCFIFIFAPHLKQEKNIRNWFSGKEKADLIKNIQKLEQSIDEFQESIAKFQKSIEKIEEDKKDLLNFFDQYNKLDQEKEKIKEEIKKTEEEIKKTEEEIKTLYKKLELIKNPAHDVNLIADFRQEIEEVARKLEEKGKPNNQGVQNNSFSPLQQEEIKDNFIK